MSQCSHRFSRWLSWRTRARSECGLQFCCSLVCGGVAGAESGPAELRRCANMSRPIVLLDRSRFRRDVVDSAARKREHLACETRCLGRVEIDAKSLALV